MDFTDQFSGGDLHLSRGEWSVVKLPWYDGRGNISFMTNDVDVAKTVLEWTDGGSRYETPKCRQDLQDEGDVAELLERIIEVMTLVRAKHAFPAEMDQDEAEEATPQL